MLSHPELSEDVYTKQAIKDPPKAMITTQQNSEIDFCKTTSESDIFPTIASNAVSNMFWWENLVRGYTELLLKDKGSMNAQYYSRNQNFQILNVVM